jgi:tetratricopeptide (TPR) repeat protein
MTQPNGATTVFARYKFWHLMILLLLLAACNTNNPSQVTPVATLRGALIPTRIPTETPIPTNTPSSTPTETPTATFTPSEVPTDTPTHTATPTNTPLPSDTPTNTSEPSPTPTSEAGALLEQAKTLLDREQYNRAIEVATQGLAIEPDNTELLNTRGLAYYNLDDYPNALIDFERYIELDQEDFIGFYNVGFVRNLTQDYEGAIEAFTQALTIEPLDVETITGRANAYYSLRRYDEAIADYSSVLEQEPDNTYALSSRGYAYAYQGNIPAANDDFVKYIEVAGADVDTAIVDIVNAIANGEDVRPLLGIEPQPGEVIVIEGPGDFTQQGSITNESFEVRFEFMGRRGAVIGIQMNVVDGDIDPFVILLDGEGNELASNDDDPEGTDKNAYLRGFELPTDGKYTIIATRFQQDLGSTTGRFALVLERGGNLPPPDGTPVAGPPLPIRCDQTVTGRLDDAHFEMRFTFRTNALALVGIEMKTTSGDLDPYLKLLDATEQLLVENDDDPRGSGGDAFVRDVRLNTPGQYIIVATRFQENLGSTSGEFTLRLTCPRPQS